jgi:hypothetical protein
MPYNVLRTPEEPKKVERNALVETNIPKETNDLGCLESLAFLVCAVTGLVVTFKLNSIV